MPDIRDPFDDLRRPLVPLVPRPEFVASLFNRLREEFGMTSTVGSSRPRSRPRSRSAASQWSISVLTMPTVRCSSSVRCSAGRPNGSPFDRPRQPLHDQHDHDDSDPRRRRVRRPSCRTTPWPTLHMSCARSVDGGGQITEAEPAPDGGGWARGVDDQGLPLLVYRPGGYHAHAAPTRAASGRARVGVHPRRRDEGRRVLRRRRWAGASSPPIPAVTTSTRCPVSASSTRPPPSVGPSSRRRRCTSASTPCSRCCSRSNRSADAPEITRKTWARTSRPCAPTIRARRSASCRPRSTPKVSRRLPWSSRRPASSHDAERLQLSSRRRSITPEGVPPPEVTTAVRASATWRSPASCRSCAMAS